MDAHVRMTLWAVWVGGCSFLLGCSTVQVRTDHDPSANFSQYRTFAFAGGKTINRVGAVTVEEPLVSERIKDSVARQLEAKGLTPSGENPDLMVTFVAGAHERVELETTAEPYYAGYGWGGWGPGWWGPGYEDWWTRRYTQGTLIVDLIDARTKRLVWRAYTMAEIDNPKQAPKLIDEALTKAFQQYPPPTAAYGGSGPAAPR